MQQQPITNSNKEIRLFIQLDQPLYKAGDTVTGKIFLEALTPYSGNLLNLKIKGYEISYFEKKKTATQLEKDEPVEFAYFVPHQGKKMIYNTTTPIYQWKGDKTIIPVGQYVFPFAFSLLETLPSNFSEDLMTGEKKYKAVVKYKVKAFIDGPNKEKIKNSSPLIIRKPLFPEQLQPKSSSFTVEPVTWCCLSKGETILKMLMNKSAHVAGETVQLKIEIDHSSCSLAMQDLSISLVQYINLYGDDGKSWMLKTEIQKQVFQGIKAKQKPTGDSTRQCEFKLQFPDSKAIQPSTQGNLVICEYYLLIQINFNGVICCDENYDCKLPIIVTPFPEAPANSNNFYQLPNWKPQIFEAVNVSVIVAQ